LQQLSIKALRSRLPEEQFLFRDERMDDKGVDGALEVKLEVRTPMTGGGEEVKSLFTNCRAQAQLKSTDTPKRNQDGSVSYAIETSNLNYLLNGQSPLYFLWLAPDDEIRYAWARDEWRRLDAETPGWRGQGTITVRFERVLNAQALDEIHARIFKEAQFTRRINEALARSALAERVVVSIDPQTLKTTDPRKIHEWLTSSGMTIVSAGYGRQILDWIDVLNPEARREGRVRLIAAYAEASLGRYHAAVGHLAEAALRRAELPPSDQHFLDYLRSACEYHTGRIDLKEYLRREEEWAKRQAGAAAAEHRLESLRQERLRERDQDRRAAMLAEMRALVDEIKTAADATPAHKLQARVLLFGAEGDDLSAQLIENLSLIQTREAMGYATEQTRRQAAEVMKRTWEQWQESAGRILDEAAELGHPLLTADALAARVAALVGVLQMQRLDAVANGTRGELPEPTLHGLMGDAQRALEIYARAGSVEGETRAKLLLADLFETAGQEGAAKSLAEGALVVAQAMSYARLEAHAGEHITGQTIVRQFEAKLAERQQEDEDVHIADAADEDLRGMARHTLRSIGLPAERLPVVERECFSLRTIARERISWCQHLQLLQNLIHQQSPSTHYRTDPPRVCRCDLHGYTSALEHPDPDTVIAAFKQAHCAGCSDRAPKARNVEQATTT
jgi:hypothetical protein